jgi:hypothetical protein
MWATRPMVKTILFIMMFTPVFNVIAQTGVKTTDKRLTPLTSDTVVNDWEAGSTLTSLIRAGFTNKMAIGIVLEGDSLCRSSVLGSSKGIHIGSLIDQVQKQNPNYVVEIRPQTLYVHPKTMTASTLAVLQLPIPQFSAKSGSAQQIGITLWMFIRGVLVPKETSMFTGGLQRNAEILPAVNLSNASVHDILDHIVSLGQGGGWIMYEVPADWHSDPKTLPYELFSYYGEERSANLLHCPADNPR